MRPLSENCSWESGSAGRDPPEEWEPGGSCLFKWPNPRWPLWLHMLSPETPQIPAFGGPSWVGFRFSDIYRLSVPCAGAWAAVERHGWVLAGLCACVHTPLSSSGSTHILQLLHGQW